MRKAHSRKPLTTTAQNRLSNLAIRTEKIQVFASSTSGDDTWVPIGQVDNPFYISLEEQITPKRYTSGSKYYRVTAYDPLKEVYTMNDNTMITAEMLHSYYGIKYLNIGDLFTVP